MNELHAIIRALHDSPATPAALATLVSVEGSSYRRAGARLLVRANGERIGSISGGCLEEDVINRAGRVLSSGTPAAVVYDTTSENDLVWGVGLGCHGIVKVLLEKISGTPPWAKELAANFLARRPTSLAVVHDRVNASEFGTYLATDLSGIAATHSGVFEQMIHPPPALFVFGAGDDARPLVRLAKALGWHVTVADPRAAFVTKARFPDADQLVAAPAGELVARVQPDAGSLAVVMTHHYVHDVPLLGALLRRPLAYLGLLGPKKRAEKILADLEKQGGGLSPDRARHLYSPTGLDLGADGPEQVALAIVAEMQAVLAGRDARPLRERNRPIHA